MFQRVAPFPALSPEEGVHVMGASAQQCAPGCGKGCSRHSTPTPLDSGKTSLLLTGRYLCCASQQLWALVPRFGHSPWWSLLTGLYFISCWLLIPERLPSSPVTDPGGQPYYPLLTGLSSCPAHSSWVSSHITGEQKENEILAPRFSFHTLQTG